MWRRDHSGFTGARFVIDCIECSSVRILCSMCELNFNLKLQDRFVNFNFWHKQNSAPLKKNNNIIYLLQHTCPLKGEKKTQQNTLENSIILPFKLFVHVIFFPLRCSLKVVSFPVVFYRGCVLITSPCRCLCFIELKPSLRLPPAQLPPPVPLGRVI